ncbi:hypothetical protein FIBSPDRAFT_952916 [Athelia psychrophila]|uniref:Uncharacterized protein n=1 Tax=Athelia psychrophila TaxID=1759441 RepID=A0A166KVP8_9AGAM|nr:hypothetical protein FIBSPDRAFT_952916 [Fibularhizoctonia sp. CBS 109695]
MRFTLLTIAAFASLTGFVSAGHSIHIVNRCGYGTPTLAGPGIGPTNISGGYSSSGSITGVIVYLQNGRCGANGENCLIRSRGNLERRLLQRGYQQDTPSRLYFPLGFAYNDGKAGRECNNANCQCNYDAYCGPNDNGAIVGDPNPNVNIKFENEVLRPGPQELGHVHSNGTEFVIPDSLGESSDQHVNVLCSVVDNVLSM